ncbi:MAG: DUF4159 domain-containing protein [Pirellulaceae bacterium]
MVFATLLVSSVCLGQAANPPAPDLPRPVKSRQQLSLKSPTFTFVRIQHSVAPARGRRAAHWATDYPDSDIQLTARIAADIGMATNAKGQVLRLTDPQLKSFPFIYLVEPGSLELTDAEVESLREYLTGGGFLMVDDCWGAAERERCLAQFKRVFPDREPRELPLHHEIFHCFYDLTEKPQVPSVHTWASRASQDLPAVSYQGLFDDAGRMAVILCLNTDLGDGWERSGDDERYAREMSQRRAFPMGVNIVVYALTH